MPPRGKAHTMSVEQALQISASLAQAMNAIRPNPDLVQKMIGQPRFLQDRLRMLLENPIPEPSPIDDKSWKLSLVTMDVKVWDTTNWHSINESVLVRPPSKDKFWESNKDFASQRPAGGVAYGYLANKEFDSVGEILRTAMDTESDSYLERMVFKLDLIWDIRQIMHFLCDYVWEGRNPLHLLTDGSYNYFLVHGLDNTGRQKESEVGFLGVALRRIEGQSKWTIDGRYAIGSDDFEYHRLRNEPASVGVKGCHFYFKNDPRAELGENWWRRY